MTELHVPDISAMAAGRKAAETAKELRDLKRKTSLLVSALRTVVEDRNAALGRAILWRWIAALELVMILSFIAVGMLKV